VFYCVKTYFIQHVGDQLNLLHITKTEVFFILRTLAV